MRENRILNTVVSNLPEPLRVALRKTTENLLDRHVVFLIFEKMLRHVVQRVRLEFVLALDVLKKIKDVTTLHRNQLELVVAERARTQHLDRQLGD